MPTVHISLPSKTYEELKQKAGDLGIQVTDLIKIYIRNGLERGFSQKSCSSEIGVIEEKIRNLEASLKAIRKIAIRAEGRFREAMEYYQFLNERIDMIEDMVIPLIRAREEAKQG